MAVPISNYEEFKDIFDSLKYSRDLFAFFLFDERPSHQAVERFADEQFDWLDELAVYARIFFFIFLRRDQETEPSYEYPYGAVINPSLQVAQEFGISPSELPGVVLFTLSEDKINVSEAIYLQVDAKLFADDISHVESVFSDLFTLIGDCRKEDLLLPEFLKELRSRVRNLTRREKFRPVSAYLKASVKEIAKLPQDLPRIFVTAFADALAYKMTGGP